MEVIINSLQLRIQSVNKCMSGDLRHSGHWDAVIGEVLKEQRDGYQR